MKKLFFVIGAPGSGKTTDASIIAKQNPDTVVHYSTGDMLREEVAAGGELGKKIDSFISKGELVPLDIIVNTIISAIKKSPVDTVLIDGYPRSTEQMIAFDDLSKTQNDIDLVSVIEVQVSEAVAKQRILGRAAEASAEELRSDDNAEVFAHRMKIYTDPLTDIQDFYQNKGILHPINGERTMEEVVEEMEKFVLSKA